VVVTSDRRVGSLLSGRWLLKRVLGSGGTATIYEAQDGVGARVAVKIVHPGLSTDETTRLRLLREAYIAREVAHPGVVQVFETGTDELGAPFLVMELLEGRSLELMRRDSGGRLPVPFVVSVAERVLEVLAAAHQRSVIHRDLKPGNLFATDDDRIKVLDFGIADSRRIDPRLSANTEHGQLMGTPAFMPSEQALGRWQEVDHRSDLWALGATMFTLLTGRTVHDARDKSEQLALAMSTPVRPVRSVMSDLPSPLENAIDGALAFDRDARWQSAEEMLAALRGQTVARRDKMLGGETDRGLERAVALVQPAPRRQGAWKTLFALGLCVALGSIASLWLLRSPPEPSRPATASAALATPAPTPRPSAAVLPAPSPSSAAAEPAATATSSATRRTRPLAPALSSAAPPLVESSAPPPAPVDTTPSLLELRR
jgi:eukaryotic-like serine/threonine-protein kinase